MENEKLVLGASGKIGFIRNGAFVAIGEIYQDQENEHRWIPRARKILSAWNKKLDDEEMRFSDINDALDLITNRIEQDYYWEDGGYVRDWIREDLISLIEKSWEVRKVLNEQKNV